MSSTIPHPARAAGSRPFDLGAAFTRFPAEFALPRSVAVAINALGIGLLATFAVLLSLYDTHDAAFRFRSENGPVENTSFALFLLAAILAWQLATRVRGLGQDGRVAAFYAAFGALAILAAMEEISWGQSWFNYATPWGLRDVNEQGELNVHNLPGVMDLNLILLFAFGLLLLTGIALGARRAWQPVAVPGVLLPLAITITVAGLIQVIAEKFLPFYTFNMVVTSLAEIVEWMMALSCVAYVWLNERRLRRVHGSTPGDLRPAP